MSTKPSKAVRKGREAALGMAWDLWHSLTCPNCGLRQEALHVLELLRWTEEEFKAAAVDHLLEGLYGG